MPKLCSTLTITSTISTIMSCYAILDSYHCCRSRDHFRVDVWVAKMSAARVVMGQAIWRATPPQQAPKADSANAHSAGADSAAPAAIGSAGQSTASQPLGLQVCKFAIWGFASLHACLLQLAAVRVSVGPGFVNNEPSLHTSIATMHLHHSHHSGHAGC